MKGMVFMRSKIAAILLKIGIPAAFKGFVYICDAMELFDRDPYYFSGKMGCLYQAIARRNGSTSSQVERSIRHAFEIAVTRGNDEAVDRYLDRTNTQNANLLKTLYLRWQAEEQNLRHLCANHQCCCREQIFLEAQRRCSNEMEPLLRKMMHFIGPGAGVAPRWEMSWAEILSSAQACVSEFERSIG